MKAFAHPGSDHMIPTNINKAIDDTIIVSRHEWKYAADLDTAFDQGLPAVTCFANEVNQVLLNLIVNAVDAIKEKFGLNSTEKGRITISTCQDGPWAEIRISDTGSGIPEDIRSRLFDPFFTTKGMGIGSGQGLALAHSVIVNHHHGSISFDSELGKGTTFTVRLPLGGKRLAEV